MVPINMAADRHASLYSAPSRMRITMASSDRREHRQQRRESSFRELPSLRQHVDCHAVFRLAGALHDARDVAELAPHFDHH